MMGFFHTHVHFPFQTGEDLHPGLIAIQSQAHGVDKHSHLVMAHLVLNCSKVTRHFINAFKYTFLIEY